MTAELTAQLVIALLMGVGGYVLRHYTAPAAPAAPVPVPPPPPSPMGGGLLSHMLAQHPLMGQILSVAESRLQQQLLDLISAQAQQLVSLPAATTVVGGPAPNVR